LSISEGVSTNVCGGQTILKRNITETYTCVQAGFGFYCKVDWYVVLTVM